MVTILKHGRKIIQGSGLAIALLGLWQLFASVSQVATYTINCDLAFSENMQIGMHDLIRDQINLSGPNLYQSLKRNFPFIASFQVRRTGLNRIDVQVRAPDLAWQVGDNFVLTSAGDVQLASCFASELVHSLPKINLADNPKFASDVWPELRQFLLELPESIREEYALDWFSANQIMLTNRQSPHQKIMMRFDQLLTDQLLQNCQQLFLKYDQQAKKPCRGSIQADVRFAGQIVVAC